MQRRTSSLQAAAVVIEFVAVFYYTLKIWDYFMPIDKLPEFATFGLLTVFTALIVFYTEALGEIIRERRIFAYSSIASNTISNAFLRMLSMSIFFVSFETI